MRARTAKLLDRSFLLVATVGLAARQYDVPDKDFWGRAANGREYIVLALILTIGVFGTFIPFQTVAERHQVKRKAAVRQQVLTHFGRIIAIAARSDQTFELSDLGLHIWRVGRSFRHPMRPRLHRLATYRLGSTPATRAFTPQKGVGVVGLSWRDNKEVGMDVESLALRLPDEPTYQRYREIHGLDAVMGLPWDQFRNVSHRGAVFASPIRDGVGAFVGCVSVDAMRGFDVLNTLDLWHEINALCAELGDEGLREV